MKVRDRGAPWFPLELQNPSTGNDSRVRIVNQLLYTSITPSLNSSMSSNWKTMLCRVLPTNSYRSSGNKGVGGLVSGCPDCDSDVDPEWIVCPNCATPLDNLSPLRGLLSGSSRQRSPIDEASLGVWIQHVAIWFFISLILGLMDWVPDNSLNWAQWPILIWGFGIIVHSYKTWFGRRD